MTTDVSVIFSHDDHIPYPPVSISAAVPVRTRVVVYKIHFDSGTMPKSAARFYGVFFFRLTGCKNLYLLGKLLIRIIIFSQCPCTLVCEYLSCSMCAKKDCILYSAV